MCAATTYKMHAKKNDEGGGYFVANQKNMFLKGLHIVKDTFTAYGQRFVALFLFSLIFFGIIIFTVTYVADSLLDFISHVTDSPTLSEMEAMPVEQLLVLMVMVLFVLPLAMGGVALLAPPGQDILPEGNTQRKGFASFPTTMTYLRTQYKQIFVSNVTFFIILFFFFTILQYVLALFFMRSGATALAVVTDALLILAEILILPLAGLLLAVCLFEKTMGLAAVRRAISMAKAGKGLYCLICIAIAVITMGSSYLFDWVMHTHVITQWPKILQFAVSAAWQAVFMPLPFLSMLLFYRRTLSLHDVNVLFPG